MICQIPIVNVYNYITFQELKRLSTKLGHVRVGVDDDMLLSENDPSI
ncbi:MAG TPA: hypothetical protein VEL70_09105 [Candidatus Acidoferrum sp.]|nr:hypothetical protein [Candidatus Acidoferrum sp.]